jgi:hypothetical protein
MKDPVLIKIIDHPTRLRVRRVDEDALLHGAIQVAKQDKFPVVDVDYGGTVANAYNYPASTEAVVAVGFPNGDGWVRVNRIPANKATYAGAFSAIVVEEGFEKKEVRLFDHRTSDEKDAKARTKFINHIHNQLRARKKV